MGTFYDASSAIGPMEPGSLQLEEDIFGLLKVTFCHCIHSLLLQLLCYVYTCFTIHTFFGQLRLFKEGFSFFKVRDNISIDEFYKCFHEASVLR